MNLINKYNVHEVKDSCGMLRGLYKSSGLSIASVRVDREAKKT